MVAIDIHALNIKPFNDLSYHSFDAGGLRRSSDNSYPYWKLIKPINKMKKVFSTLYVFAISAIFSFLPSNDAIAQIIYSGTTENPGEPVVKVLGNCTTGNNCLALEGYLSNLYTAAGAGVYGLAQNPNQYGVFASGTNGAIAIAGYSTAGFSAYFYGTGKVKITGTDPSIQIGIATRPAGYQLSVDGKIVAEEIKVEASPWSDYVFEEGYNLRSIDELEHFINKNGHLPNIPSALVVESEGLQLGKHQAAVLEKIEELTLYIIQLNQKIEEQERKIQELSQDRNRDN